MSEILLFAVDKHNTCNIGLPPVNGADRFHVRATKGGTMENASHVLFSSSGQLYAVRGSEIYTGPMPSSSSEDWFQEATCVGKNDWSSMKFLFFHPNGTLYAVTDDDKFYKGPAPSNENISWLYGEATKIGAGHWLRFQSLFFDPEGTLYGIIDDSMLRGSPPTSPEHDWIGITEQLMHGGWSKLTHFISFSPDGDLWAVQKGDGKIYKSGKPQRGHNWIDSAELLGSGYTYKFMSFVRDRNIQEILTLEFKPEKGNILSIEPELVAEKVYDNRNSSVPLNSIFGFNKKYSSTSTFSHEHGFTFSVGAKTTIEAGIPMIKEVKGEIDVDLSTTHKWNFAEANTTEREFHMSSSVTVPPGKAVLQKAVVKQGKMKVPYTAKIRTMFNYETTISGTWNGACFFDLQVTQSDWK